MRICKFYKLILILLLMAIQGGICAQNADETVINDEFAYANKLLRDNYPELAVVQFKLFIKKYPGENRVAEAVRRIADSHLQMKQYAEARQAYERLNIQHPYSPFARDAYYQIAQCYSAEKEYASAAEFFELYARFSSDAENASQAMLHAGKLYLQLGKKERGRKVLFETIDHYPDKIDDKSAAQLALLYEFADSGEAHRAFRMAETFLQEFPQALAGPEVWLVKARLHKTLGQLKESLSVYKNVSSSYKNTNAARIANIESAEIKFLIGDRAGAFSQLSSVMAGGDDSLATVAQIIKAELLLQDGQKQAAIKAAETNLRFKKIGYEYYLTLGNVQFKLEKYTAALASFENALDAEFPLSDSLKSKIYVRVAHAAYRQGKADAALAALRQAREKSKRESELAQILKLEGDIYLDLLDDMPFAIRIYSQFITNFPHQPQIDDVQARLARCYEKKSNWSMALDEWNRLVKLYPVSTYFAMAKEHIALINKYQKQDFSTLLAASFAEESAITSEPLRRAKRMASLQFWDKAIALLRPNFNEIEDAAIRTEAALLMGQSYFAKAQRSRLQDEGNEFALFDSAKTVLQTAGLVWEDDAAILQKDLMLATIQQQNMLDDLPPSLDAISQKYQNQNQFAQINQHVLQNKIRTVKKSDSAAVANLKVRLQSFENSANEDRAAALYLNAQFYLSLNDSATARAKLAKIDASMTGLAVVQGNLLRAHLLLAGGELEAAQELLLRMRKPYFYSDSVQRIIFLLARVAYEKNDYSEVKKWLQLIENKEDWALYSMGSILDADTQYLKAQTEIKFGNKLAASNALLQFINRHQADDRAPDALFQLAELTAQQKFVRLARGYYDNFLQQYKNHQRAPAVRIALTKLELDEHRYIRARELGLQAVAETRGTSLNAEATYLAILAQLRQEKIQSVTSDLKIFRKNFPQADELYGNIQYELGEAHIRAKDFKKAENVFKDLRNDFKNTTFAVRGNFGLARSYLIRNKTEDGLKILKKLPEEYSGDPFLKTVHIELGDFYQAQKLWQSAITAYNYVLADTVVDEKYKEVLIKLIDLYANTGLADAAISYARHFIKYFPNDEREFNYQLKIATLYRDKREYEQAIEIYRQLLPLAHGENKAEVLFFLGDSYYNMRRYEQAAAEFMKMKYFAPKTKQNWRTTALFKAGDCYLQMENLPKARDLFDLVRRLEGEASVFGRSAKKRLEEIDAAIQKNRNTGFSSKTGNEFFIA
ncbi:MAG: hypothetical protein DWQ05_11615 [Calditrichaeota bacterium]|nr:MAG: hypothetical protein DWQ05_11615 [Calditrichota bacterium]